MKQVITIEPGGIMSGLQVKPGKGLDLTKFGPANVQRASEICWDDMAQKWFIRLTERHADLVHKLGSDPVVTFVAYAYIVGKAAPDVPHWLDADRDDDDELCGAILFDSYDQAVSVEIEFLDAARLRGLIT